METFFVLRVICAGNSPVPSWVNNGEAGDLRRHQAHYGVIVMICLHHGRFPTQRASHMHKVLISLSWMSPCTWIKLVHKCASHHLFYVVLIDVFKTDCSFFQVSPKKDPMRYFFNQCNVFLHFMISLGKNVSKWSLMMPFGITRPQNKYKEILVKSTSIWLEQRSANSGIILGIYWILAPFYKHDLTDIRAWISNDALEISRGVKISSGAPLRVQNGT